MSLFYFDENYVIHEANGIPTAVDWTVGSLSALNITAMPNSSIAAVYNWCSACTNTTVIAFQDQEGAIQIGNKTAGGWKIAPLGADAQPLPGTGIALAVTGDNRLNLYYQKTTLNMALAVWNAPNGNTGMSTINCMRTAVADSR